jgi:hypothetical protein
MDYAKAQSLQSLAQTAGELLMKKGLGMYNTTGVANA